MTDTEMQRIKAICDVAGVDDIGKLSDGFHTFDSLYEQRMVLFAALVKAYKNKAWKSYRHEDGEYCFGGGWFIVGIDTPEGSYTYHYENKYWDMFDCIDLPRAKHWDGHTEVDAETRLMSLEPERTETHACDCGKKETHGDVIYRQYAIEALDKRFDDIPMELTTEILLLRNDLRERIPSAEPAQKWIPVSERLPEEEGGYLVTGGIYKQRFVYITHWNGRFWCAKYTVWAWMPLPEPYREEEEEHEQV